MFCRLISTRAAGDPSMMRHLDIIEACSVAVCFTAIQSLGVIGKKMLAVVFS